MSKYHSTDNLEAPSKADVELSLLNEESIHTIKGSPTVISEGLKLEEQQYVHSYIGHFSHFSLAHDVQNGTTSIHPKAWPNTTKSLKPGGFQMMQLAAK